METQKVSSQISSIIQRKKLRMLKKSLEITTKTTPLFKKYAPKYARNVQIIRNDCPKATNPRLKCLYSLSLYLYGSQYGQKYRLAQSRVFKIIKHHKKYIRHCEGIHITPHLIKELPQLCSYEFDFSHRKSEEEYRILIFCRMLKRLSLNLKYVYFPSEVNSVAPTLKKNQYRMLRALVNMRSLKELSLKLSNESSVFLFTFLQVLGSCPLFLSRLNYFYINTLSYSQLNLTEDFSDDVNVRMALRFVTDLAMPDRTLFEKRVFDHELLRNLTSLVMAIKASYTCNEAAIRKLSSLKLLPRLKDFDLDFLLYSKRMEKAFLESFSLPNEIETVRLILTGFVWKDLSLKLTKENRRIIEECFEKHPRFQKFYSEWTSLSSLRTLKLTINNRDPERKCPALTLKFAMGILRHLKSLKSLKYENEYTTYKDEKLSSKILPMDLGVFWESLKNSKKTLENLEIKVPDMNFFSKKGMHTDLVGGFERLKSVEISGEIYWARNFGDFLSLIAKKSKEKVSINVIYLCFKEEKYLNDFFENMVEIPNNLEVELGLDISELNCSNWLENFCGFVARLRVEGILKLKIKEVRVESIKEVDRIQKSVFENPVFEELIIQGEKGKNFCVIKRRELVSGIDPWLIGKGHIKLDD